MPEKMSISMPGVDSLAPAISGIISTFFMFQACFFLEGGIKTLKMNTLGKYLFGRQRQAQVSLAKNNLCDNN